jgi:hypothetical protein
VDSGALPERYDELVEVSEELAAMVDAVAAGVLDASPTVQRLLVDLVESVDARAAATRGT